MAKTDKTYRALKDVVGSEASSWHNEGKPAGSIIDISHLTAGAVAMLIEMGVIEEVPAAIARQMERQAKAVPAPAVEVDDADEVTDASWDSPELANLTETDETGD